MGIVKLNRINAVLADSGKQGKWLAQQLGKDPATVSNVVYQYYSARFESIG